MSKNIINLEEKIAYLEANNEILNKVSFEQSQQINELKQTITLLNEKVTQLATKQEDNQSIDDETPPHY